MNSIVYNADCLAAMKEYPDGYFDLAVVDPPYGIGMNGGKSIGLRKKWTKSYASIKHIQKDWDNKIPDINYFDELQRISKHQIIWGGNYFSKFFEECRCVLMWDKKCEGTDFSHFEIAFTSFDGSNKKVTIPIQVESQKRIHPTQKPVALYSWIYHNYLPQGGLVLDTHLGSGSNRIAAHKAGNIDFIGYEIDKDYFEAQEKRFKLVTSQLTLL